MRGRDVRRARGAALVVLLLAAACSRGSEDPDHPLADVLITEGPEGYELVDGPSGPLSRDDAAEAFGYLRRSEVREHLVRTGYQDGYSRVWERDDDDFVTVIALEFVSGRRAIDAVAFAASGLRGLRDTEPFAVEDVPGARGYTLEGSSRSGSEALSCRIVWFARSSRAYEARACGDRMPSEDLVGELASRQLGRVEAAA